MEKNNNKQSEEIKWGGWLNEFLWTCAGANKKVLRQCPVEYAKYTGIGGTILFTALMAMLSGGYALFTVFDNQWLAIAFGIFWGLLIFNLDRFIVNTMYSDGEVTISFREFYSGLPRIIMAVFLGIVISTPLELKIFEDAIDIQIEQDKDSIMESRIADQILKRDSINLRYTKILEGENSIQLFDQNIITSNETTNRLIGERNELNAQKAGINSDIANLKNRLNQLYIKITIIEETESNEYKTISNQINSLRQQINSKNKELTNIQSEIDIKENEISSQNKNLGDLVAAKKDEGLKEANRLKIESDSIGRIIAEANVRHTDWSDSEIKMKGSLRDKLDVQYKGFQAKMHAFNMLKEKEPATATCSLFIMLLFIIIETAPTFFKMMISSGPYDDLLRAEMHRISVLSQKRISDINDEVNTSVTISTEQNKNRLAAETLANKELLEQVAAAQAEILKEAIELWRQEELEKVRSNPSEYIKTGATKI